MTKTLSEATPGFAIKLEAQTLLESGLLIAEDDAGRYVPVGWISTISEAREIAGHDIRRRMKDLEGGGEPFCPTACKVWASGLDGVIAVAESFDAASA